MTTLLSTHATGGAVLGAGGGVAAAIAVDCDDPPPAPAAVPAMNEYIAHVASGRCAIPPGVQARGDWLGQARFNT